MLPELKLVYEAKLKKLIDGDTLHVYRKDEPKVRLLRVDTPERGHGGYAEVNHVVAAWLSDGAEFFEYPLVIERKGFDSFGRELCEVYRKLDGTNLNQFLYDKGFIYRTGIVPDRTTFLEKVKSWLGY